MAVGTQTPQSATHTGTGLFSRRPGGFSLIELLVAIVILGLILGVVYQSFATISTHAQRESEGLAERQDLRMLLNLVATELQAVQHLQEYYKTGHVTGIRAETQLEGVEELSSVSLHAAVPARFHRAVERGLDPELHEIGYSIRQAAADGSEGQGLVLVRREDYYIDDDLESGGLEVVVADRIASFFIEYLPEGEAVGTPQERWETRWDSEERPGAPLPLAIRITLGRELAQQPAAQAGQDADEDEGPKTIQETLELNLSGALGVSK